MGDGDIRERLPQIHPMGESTVNEVVPRRLRGQTLFYADAVNVLRTIYPTKDYSYLDGDGFKGEFLILRENQILISVEIKSELETKAVSSKKTGEAFKELRAKIHALRCLEKNGKAQGWIAFLAQCWDYMANRLPEELRSGNYTKRDDVLVIPSDKEPDLENALHCISAKHPDCPKPTTTALRYPSDNITILIYAHQNLTDFFQKIQHIEE
jgi:hypothetical protein